MLRYLFMIILFSVFAVSPTRADSSPQSALDRVVYQLKKKGDPSAIVDQVYWDEAIKHFPPLLRQKLHINSPADLKAYYAGIFTSPLTALTKRAEADPKMSKENLLVLQERMKETAALVATKAEEIRRQIRTTDYQVGQCTTNGDVGQVTLFIRTGGNLETRPIDMIRVNKRWLLADLTLLADPMSMLVDTPPVEPVNAPGK